MKLNIIFDETIKKSLILSEKELMTEAKLTFYSIRIQTQILLSLSELMKILAVITE